MAYRALIQNKVTGQYLSNKGEWMPRPTQVSLETKQQAYNLAAKMNATVVSIVSKATKGI
jgi:hypothetical protein